MKTVNQTTGIVVRKSNERGAADHGWLKSFHSFSFADYFDPKYMGFRSLRVINEDWVAPGMGFGMHPHQDMEIFTYVIEGGLAHKDSMGHESTIKAGDVQKITAGTGIYHSEFNASDKQKVHLLQIWILPNKKSLKPGYEEFSLPKVDPGKPLYLMGSPEGTKNNHVAGFNQDVYLYRGVLKADQNVNYGLKKDRGLWVQVVHGEVSLNAIPLAAGDAASSITEGQYIMKAQKDSEFLLFDLR